MIVGTGLTAWMVLFLSTNRRPQNAAMTFFANMLLQDWFRDQKGAGSVSLPQRPATERPGDRFECVFLASGLEGSNKGGIQTSAQLAWDAVRAHCRSEAAPSALLSYGDEPSAAVDENHTRIVCARSRFEVLGRILRHRWEAHHVLCWHLGLAKLLPFLRRGPAQVSVFLHGIEAWRPLGRFTSFCLRGVHQFLTNSALTWQRFIECNPRFADYPHQVVHLGIGEPLNAEPEPPLDPPAALMLGRLMRANGFSKGHEDVISAWPRVCQRLPGAQLWIAGAGDLRPELERLAMAQGCGDSIVFWGRVSEEKKSELLQRCRCLALPSRGEGFGLVYAEAMRQGRPCLVSDQDAGREVVHTPEAGLAVDPRDPGALTEALVELLRGGPSWPAWSAAARRRYELQFTAGHFQARLRKAVFQPLQ